MPTCDLLPCSYTSTFSRTYPEAASMVQYNFVLTLFRKPYMWLRFIWLKSCAGTISSHKGGGGFLFLFPVLISFSLFLFSLSLQPVSLSLSLSSSISCASFLVFLFHSCLSVFFLFFLFSPLSLPFSAQLWFSDLLLIFIFSSYSFWDTVLILYIFWKFNCMIFTCWSSSVKRLEALCSQVTVPYLIQDIE